MNYILKGSYNIDDLKPDDDSDSGTIIRLFAGEEQYFATVMKIFYPAVAKAKVREYKWKKSMFLYTFYI